MAYEICLIIYEQETLELFDWVDNLAILVNHPTRILLLLLMFENHNFICKINLHFL